jgi:hypothetical protein
VVVVAQMLFQRSDRGCHAQVGGRRIACSYIVRANKSHLGDSMDYLQELQRAAKGPEYLKVSDSTGMAGIGCRAHSSFATF